MRLLFYWAACSARYASTTRPTESFFTTVIDDLVSSGKLPESLKEVPHGLKDLRNFGAHGNLGDLDPKDAPLLESRCRALLISTQSRHYRRTPRSVWPAHKKSAMQLPRGRVDA